jgi:hypothetical protein
MIDIDGALPMDDISDDFSPKPARPKSNPDICDQVSQATDDCWPRIPPGRHVTPEHAASHLRRKLREIAHDAGKGIDEFLDNTLFWLEHEVMITKVWNHAHRIRFGDVRRGDITAIANAVRWYGMSIEVATERYFRRGLN